MRLCAPVRIQKTIARRPRVDPFPQEQRRLQSLLYGHSNGQRSGQCRMWCRGFPFHMHTHNILASICLLYFFCPSKCTVDVVTDTQCTNQCAPSCVCMSQSLPFLAHFSNFIPILGHLLTCRLRRLIPAAPKLASSSKLSTTRLVAAPTALELVCYVACPPCCQTHLGLMVQQVLELTHNHGTETKEGPTYHSGNADDMGFGHIGL